MLVACFAIATFSYAAFSTMALSLPADLFHSRAVGVGRRPCPAPAPASGRSRDLPDRRVADRFSFPPILIAASVVPLLGATVVICLFRNTPASGGGLVKVI